jgi:hypothetical protein
MAKVAIRHECAPFGVTKGPYRDFESLSLRQSASAKRSPAGSFLGLAAAELSAFFG